MHAECRVPARRITRRNSRPEARHRRGFGLRAANAAVPVADRCLRVVLSGARLNIQPGHWQRRGPGLVRVKARLGPDKTRRTGPGHGNGWTRPGTRYRSAWSVSVSYSFTALLLAGNARLALPYRDAQGWWCSAGGRHGASASESLPQHHRCPQP